jgi:two-component sensor histidine kinase
VRAVLAVGVYSSYFDAIYREAATWPGARAGLYAEGGHVLGRLQTPERASPPFIAAIEAAMRSTPTGTRMIPENGRDRIVSWKQSEQYPSLYATSSQPVDAALQGWMARSWTLAAAALLGILGFLGVAVYGSRAAQARTTAQLNEMLAREVHHRIKNSLQMVTALLSLRARQSGRAEVKATLASVSAQIAAVANVHEALQSTRHLERVDLCEVLRPLCENLAVAAGKAVVFTDEGPAFLDADRATLVAIVVNEIATNALKHARSTVEVGCLEKDGRVTITVGDDGPGLPDDFEDRRTKQRFGLRTALSLAARARGELTWSSSPSGATFHLLLPPGPSGS